MEFRVLGPIELYDEVRCCRVELNGPKQRALLATLLVRPSAVILVEHLIEELWGSCPPAKAVNALQAHVARLRRLLQQHEPDRAGPERLVTRTHGYSLLVDPTETDVGRFRRACARARELTAERPADAAIMLRAALKLWRGDALEGELSGAICAFEANLLDEERLNAQEALYDACLRANQHSEAVSELQDLAATYPMRERFYDQLMVALYRCGRQTEALGVYETARRRLATELGLDPTPALAQRMQEILSHTSPPSATQPAIPRVPLAADSDKADKKTSCRQQQPVDVDHEIIRLRRAVDRLTREHAALAHTLDQLSSAVQRTQRDGRIYGHLAVRRG